MRKKWTEEEEAALIQEYSNQATSGALSRLKTRERKFQPIADRVNSLHHLRDPVSFPFRWSWRDVSIKIQNMRHQYIGVKQKVRSPSGCAFDWSAGERHWPNFFLYKQVFGDTDLESAPSISAVIPNPEGVGEEEEGDEGENNEFILANGEDGIPVRRFKSTSRCGLTAAKRLVELGEFMLNREQKRRYRDRKRDEEREEEQCKREEEHRSEIGTAEMQERRWKSAEEQERWRRREKRWEEEEMEWRERVLGMQMEHEKHMLQMHLDACQAQAQMLGFLVRLASQFIASSGGTDAGMGGIANQVLHNLQQQQQQQHHHRHPDDPASIQGENDKSDTSSPGPYI